MVDKPRLIIEYEGKLYEFLTGQGVHQNAACSSCAFIGTGSCGSKSMMDCHDASDFIVGLNYAWRILK